MCVKALVTKGGSMPSLRCESRIFGSRTAPSVAITNCAMCMWKPEQNQEKRWVHEPTKYSP